MCRLLGFRATTPATLEQALLTQRNSLRAQSWEHEDGWGVAAWTDAQSLSIEHGLSPAHADPRFERVSQALCARTLLAHVRRASVGRVSRCNAHPFHCGRWVFAHNGTVQRFEAHASALEAQIAPALRTRILGQTDSERCFYLALTHLERLQPVDPSLLDVARALARTMEDVARVADAGCSERSSLNFMLTDGERLVATRRLRSLHVTRLESGGVLVASEPIEPGNWCSVPEEGVIGVDRDLTLHQWSVTDLIR